MIATNISVTVKPLPDVLDLVCTRCLLSVLRNISGKNICFRETILRSRVLDCDRNRLEIRDRDPPLTTSTIAICR